MQQMEEHLEELLIWYLHEIQMVSLGKIGKIQVMELSKMHWKLVVIQLQIL